MYSYGKMQYLEQYTFYIQYLRLGINYIAHMQPIFSLKTAVFYRAIVFCPRHIQGPLLFGMHLTPPDNPGLWIDIPLDNKTTETVGQQ